MVDPARPTELRQSYRPHAHSSSEALLQGLTSRSTARFEDALEAAVRTGAEGEQALVEALSRVPVSRRPAVVDGIRRTASRLPATNLVLEGVVADSSGHASQALKVAAMGALSARMGAAVTPVLLKVLRTDPHADTKDAALRYLAAVGDASAVPDAVGRLRRLLRHPSRDVEGRVSALAYLGQHLGAGTEEMALVVRDVREHWQAVDPTFERPWIDGYWPELTPAGPPAGLVPAPDPRPLRGWARSTTGLVTAET